MKRVMPISTPEIANYHATCFHTASAVRRHGHHANWIWCSAGPARGAPPPARTPACTSPCEGGGPLAEFVPKKRTNRTSERSGSRVNLFCHRPLPKAPLVHPAAFLRRS